LFDILLIETLVIEMLVVVWSTFCWSILEQFTAVAFSSYHQYPH